MVKGQIRTNTGYNPNFPLDVRPAGERSRDGVEERQFTFTTPFGRRRAAFMVRPERGEEPFAAILYVHWYESEAPNSNRTQFLGEAIDLAGRGVVSLLVETMWSDRDWFIKRSQAGDYDASLQQIAELRLALDLLLAEPGVDAGRLAYVGHDFGGMYGISMGASDQRPKAYVVMAATPRFPDWFLYYPPLEGDEREAFIQQMAPLDPITNVAALAPAPVFFQFATDDPHVPKQRAEEFFAAAAEPKQVGWYQAGHALNEQADADRRAWLAEQLRLN